MIAVHYYLVFKMKLAYIILGTVIASFYISTVVFSNH